MKKKWYYVDNHKVKWLIMVVSIPHGVRYNQGWIHSDQHPTVKDVLPRDTSKEQMGFVMVQGTGSLPEWNLDINRVQFIGTGVHLYYREGNPRGRNYLYWKNLWIQCWSRHKIIERNNPGGGG